MLKHLSIRNYAIIDTLDIDFGEGLNTITGETGAGKSIILGALSLVLGERADTKVLFNQHEKCTVEAIFSADSSVIEPLLLAHELDIENETVLRREINAAGKSRAFINDTPVTLQMLKKIGERLVHLHSQHETLSLTESGFQRQALDTLANNASLLSEYADIFLRYKSDLTRLGELIAQQQRAAAEHDYLNFLLNELNEAKIEAGEQQQLEDEQKTLSHAESIKIAVQKAVSLINEQEISAVGLIADSMAELRQVKQFHKPLHEVFERLQMLSVELKDIYRELEKLADDISVQPERLNEVNERLLLLHRLCKKHQVDDADDLLKVREELLQKTKNNLQLEHEINQLEKKIANTEIDLQNKARLLHERRLQTAPVFSQQVSELLQKVGMFNAFFAIEVHYTENRKLTETGFSEVSMMFSANKGVAPQPLKNVASGGELSRLMLCIKSVLAEAATLPTMIFDEIDTGISGEVARQVGEMMKKLSRHHQLICITHLPQIASAGHRHFYIFKEEKNEKTFTRVKLLSEEERIREIAQMLSGKNITQAALDNAKELIQN